MTKLTLLKILTFEGADNGEDKDADPRRASAARNFTFASGSSHICRDEVLVMGLIAGIQNNDEEAASLCLTELSCATRCDEVALAAGSFALVLRGLDKHLLPIPASVLRDILARSHPAWRDTQPNPTIH